MKHTIQQLADDETDLVKISEPKSAPKSEPKKETDPKTKKGGKGSSISSSSS